MSQVGVIASVSRDGKFTVAATDNDTDDQTDDGQQQYVAASPNPTKPRGWKRVTQCFPSLSRRKKRQALLPPLSEEDRKKGKKTLVLDLDETLVHASFEPVDGPDFIVPVKFSGTTHHAYVRVRPGAQQFLTAMAPMFEIVVFTASLQKYANPVIDHLDPGGVVQHRLFRESCVQFQNNFIKDLSLLGRDLSKTIIIDNAPTSYLFHPQNALPCVSWFDDPTDHELLDFIPLLTAIAKFEDVVEVLQHMNSQRMPASSELYQQTYVRPLDDDEPE